MVEWEILVEIRYSKKFENLFLFLKFIILDIQKLKMVFLVNVFFFNFWFLIYGNPLDGT